MSGFTIPNTPDSFNQNQAEPDSLDFQILGNQRSGVVSGCAVSTNATAQKVTVAAGEVLINGSYYPYAGGVVDLTAYTSPAFFDVIYARLSGSTVTCYAVAPATGSTNPRFPSSGSGANQVNLDTTDVVLASVYRVDNSVVDSGAIVDKRVFVRSTTNRTLGDTVSANRGSAGDTFVNTSWTPGSTTASPFSVKVGATWYNLAYWTANSNISTSGTITAGSFVGPLSGNATTATSATSATSAGTVPWSGVSGKPSLVENNNGTYSINISGSAGYASNAGYANSTNLAATASRLQYGTTLFMAQNYPNHNGNDFWDVFGDMDLNGTVFYINPGPSSVTEGIVRTSTGELKKNSASGVSLRDYKEDIVPMENALAKLSLLQPRNFRFKEEILVPNEPYDIFNRRTQLQYGFVMEEVQESVPDLVMHKSSDGINHEAMYWKEPGMIALAIGAIQELLAKVDLLEARVEALEGK
jgi:hypothetical protein